MDNLGGLSKKTDHLCLKEKNKHKQRHSIHISRPTPRVLFHFIRGHYVLSFALFCQVLLAWEKLSIGGMPLRTLNHSSVTMGDNIFVYGGLLDGAPIDNLMMFNTGWCDIITVCCSILYCAENKNEN